ncbi:flagellar hook-length control protein FliK [Marinobacter confluentis]|uniref:Flagellar hook-length control protein FliK n=1 Tax=Marinobacter confluentis TaxID=1697557 RepID=A0A4Z1CB86_9GAMM|nr:flagellar hook-length control protein FliK [Marinobacter confluentis]TGN41256.1 flagellar hook-length control protein FliK [Marinobacter confluentis]
MKVPNGNLPPPAPDGPLQTARAALQGQPAEVSQANSARAQLAQLNLANRETVLARVAEVINQQSTGASRLLLDVRGQSLAVNATIGETALETGDWVKVMRAGNELRLMGKLATAAESTVARALAQRLPWQQSLDAGLARVLTALTSGVRADAGTAIPAPATGFTDAAQPLPPGVRQAIEQLATLLPNRQALSALVAGDAGPRGQAAPPAAGSAPLGGSGAATTTGPGAPAANQIRQWLEQSGVFAESRTARAPDAPPADLKLAIGRIIHQLLELQGQNLNAFNRLTPIPSPDLVQAPLQFPAASSPQMAQFSSEPVSVGQMLRLLAGVLNRITVNQLHSQILSTRTTADAPAPNNTLVVDLPWLNQNNEPRVIQVRVEEQARESDNDRNNRSRNTEWKLSLAMNLDEAGALHFDVSLGFGKVSAQVWAERQSTLQQARERLPELRRSLVDLGLEVTDLECRRGIPRGATTHLEHRLVDTRA